MIHQDNQIAQLTEQLTDDLEVVSSNPTGDNFLTKFILFCVALDLSDNLTETCIVKNSIWTHRLNFFKFET